MIVIIIIVIFFPKYHCFLQSKIRFFLKVLQCALNLELISGRRGRDSTVVGFATTYAISAFQFQFAAGRRFSPCQLL